MGIFQGRIVRDLLEPQHLPQGEVVLYDLHRATVVDPVELSQHQHGEKLMLREIVFGELRGIGRNGPASRPERHLGQRHRRLGHRSCSVHTLAVDQPSVIP